MVTKNEYIVPMVARALDILKYLSDGGGFHGVQEISYVLDLPKATVFKLLYTLQQNGFVTKNASDEYALGLAFITYGEELKNNMDFRFYTKPIMERAARKYGESINLGILVDDTVLVIDTVKGEEFFIVRHLIPYSPLYCSGMGKIFLSQYNKEEFQNYLNHHSLQPRTVSTITDPVSLEAECKTVREEGLAFDKEEYEYGLTCVATGVYKKGVLIGAISLSGPTSRLQHKGMAHMEQGIRQVAQEISNIPSIEQLMTY